MQKLRDGPGSRQQVEIKEAEPAAGCGVLGKQCEGESMGQEQESSAGTTALERNITPHQACGSSALDSVIRQARDPGGQVKGTWLPRCQFLPLRRCPDSK